MSVDPSLLLRLDESIRADLQAIRDGFFFWLLISTGAVLVGVLLEGPDVFRGVRKTAARINPNLWSMHAAATAPESLWAKLTSVLSLVGWFVLVVGLVGEGVFEGFMSNADGLLQAFNVTALTDAIRYASAANERSRGLLKDLEEARKAVSEAERETARLNLASGKMRQTLGPRFLTREQQTRIAGKLSRFAGTPVDVYIYANTSLEEQREAVPFASSVWAALMRAGLNAGEYHSVDGWPISGIWIDIPKDPPSSVLETARAIGNAITEEGFSVESPVQIGLPVAASQALHEKLTPGVPTHIKIVIGRKPTTIMK